MEMNVSWSSLSVTSPTLITDIPALISASCQKIKKEKQNVGSWVTGVKISISFRIKLASLTIRAISIVKTRAGFFHLRGPCNAWDGAVGFRWASHVLVMASPVSISTVSPPLPPSPAFLRLYVVAAAFSFFSIAERAWGKHISEDGNSSVPSFLGIFSTACSKTRIDPNRNQENCEF